MFGILPDIQFAELQHVFISEMSMIGSDTALDTAHRLAIAELERDPSDEGKLRYLLPTLKFRLGRQQECYSYVKW